MSKVRITRKELKELSGTLVQTGYCDLQDLLYNHSADFYNCGVYGWNFDVYRVYGLNICTGYRGMIGKPLNYAETRETNKEARKIREASWKEMSGEEAKLRIEYMLQQFCLHNGGHVETWQKIELDEKKGEN